MHRGVIAVSHTIQTPIFCLCHKRYWNLCCQDFDWLEHCVHSQDLAAFAGKANDITIKNEKGRLSKEEIDRMVQDAEKFAAEDEKARQRVEAKNALESYAFSVRSTIREPQVRTLPLLCADSKKVAWQSGCLDCLPSDDSESFIATALGPASPNACLNLQGRLQLVAGAAPAHLSFCKCVLSDCSRYRTDTG